MSVYEWVEETIPEFIDDVKKTAKENGISISEAVEIYKYTTLLDIADYVRHISEILDSR
jgi:hypothetical protein